MFMLDLNDFEYDIATYFNLKTGRTQAAYFTVNNKKRLAEMETKLM